MPFCPALELHFHAFDLQRVIITHGPFVFYVLDSNVMNE